MQTGDGLTAAQDSSLQANSSSANSMRYIDKEAAQPWSGKQSHMWQQQAPAGKPLCNMLASASTDWPDVTQQPDSKKCFWHDEQLWMSTLQATGNCMAIPMLHTLQHCHG